ncbi:hypothetical protein ACFX15_040072 [Malus domestica]
MIHLLWNCHSLGSDTIVHALHRHRPAMVFLSEIKMKNHRIAAFRRTMGYDNGFDVPPVGLAGGLNLWWDNGMERRRQNKIVKINDGNGQWVENASQIRKTIGEHYKSLFASEGPRDWGKLLNFMEQKVTTKMNLTLTCPISDSELRM